MILPPACYQSETELDVYLQDAVRGDGRVIELDPRAMYVLAALELGCTLGEISRETKQGEG